MDEKEIMQALARPFAADEVEWRASQCGMSKSGKPWVRVLCYLTNRAIMNRLDEVFGISHWRNEYVKWGNDSTLCGISVRINSEWITKWDGASETDIEAVKGGLSDAMKRAAVQWGMGRYLYNLTEGFAECTLEPQRGNEWHKAITKDKNNTIFWKAPDLPDWALPEKPGKGAPDAGNAPAGKTTRANQQPAPQGPAQGQNQPQGAPPAKPPKPVTPEEKAAMLLRFMETLGVDRESIESAMGAKVEDFTPEETGIIRSAAQIMKKTGVDFHAAMTEVTR